MNPHRRPHPRQPPPLPSVQRTAIALAEKGAAFERITISLDSRPGWSLAALACPGGFVWLLGRALTALPVGTACAVWTGVGAVGTVLAGALLWGEARTPARLAGVALVVAGIAALRSAPA